MIDKKNNLNSLKLIGINDSSIRESNPKILNLLLVDRTKSNDKQIKNIIWANDNYIQFGLKEYSKHAPILPNLVTGKMENIIKPRVLKSKKVKISRTRKRGEVFTPFWIIKKQNDIIEKYYTGDDLESYVNRTWLEITAGEAPYMTTRYDMETGKVIGLDERVGFVDRKLKKISKEVNNKIEWQRLAEDAFKASYGFEWNGDSLFLARENLLYTYHDYYTFKWSETPSYLFMQNIANIISYNVFQMDGLKYTIPFTERKEKLLDIQMSLFDFDIPDEKWITKPGIRVKVMNWKTNKLEFFDKGVK